MTLPVFESAAAASAGTNSTGGTTVNYPATVNANDVLVCLFSYRTSSGSGITWPAGWTEFQPYDFANALSVWAAYKVADGSEDGGTFTVSHGDTATLRYAQVYRFSGVDTAMPIDLGALAIARGSDSSVEHSAVVTGGADRLAVAIIAVAGNSNVVDYTGETGGTWVERDEVTTVALQDATLEMCTAGMASQGTLSGGSAALDAAFGWACVTFALNPATTHAIAFDAESEAEGTSLSWTHTPAGTPKGVLVGIVENARSTLGVTAVTYGAVGMTKVLDAFDTATELGAVSVWFLGSGVPTGAQTVAVTAGADAKWGSCVTLTGPGNLEVADSDRVQENAANPTVTLQTGIGVESFVAAWAFSGLADVTALAEQVEFFQQKLTNSRDFGNQVAVATRGTASYLGGDVKAGFQSATDDMAMVAVAVKAAAAGVTVGAVASATVVRGVTPAASGAAPLPVGRVAAGSVVRGITPAGSGTVTAAVGAVAASTAVFGVTVVPGVLTVPVGAVAAATAVNGVTLAAAGSAPFTVGTVSSGAAVAGVTPAGTGTATLPLGRVAAAAVARGVTPAGSGTGAVAVGAVASALAVQGVTLAGAGAAPLPVGAVAAASVTRGVTVAASGTVAVAVGAVATATTVRGVTLAGDAATIAVGTVAATTTVRGVTLAAAGGAPLPVGAVAATSAVAGVTLTGTGAASVTAGTVTSTATVHGATVQPSGAAPLATGTVASATVVQGVTLAGAGAAVFAVGSLPATTAVLGVTLAGAALVTVGHTAGTTVVYGVTLVSSTATNVAVGVYARAGSTAGTRAAAGATAGARAAGNLAVASRAAAGALASARADAHATVGVERREYV